MHFSIPDTVELNDRSGSTYLAYNVNINGALHASVRFSDLYNFNDQLKKNFGGKITAAFPPRKILSLTAIQVEERREHLEKYLQDCFKITFYCSLITLGLSGTEFYKNNMFTRISLPSGSYYIL